MCNDDLGITINRESTKNAKKTKNSHKIILMPNSLRVWIIILDECKFVMRMILNYSKESVKDKKT